jgi:phage gpG-like protein
MKPVIETHGVKEFQRDLRRMQPEVAKELRQEIKAGAGPILASARLSAPKLSGTLARSIKLSVTARGVSIYSTVPYAPVVHWGGTISPRGVDITFARTEFITKSVEARADELVDDIGDSVERVAERLGWH